MFKIDTHVHTAEVSPCGMIRANELVKMYKERGYNAIILTDHYNERFFGECNRVKWSSCIDNFLTGYYKAKEAGEKEGITVFPALEMRFTWSLNDYLVYGLELDFLKNNKNLHYLKPNEFYKILKQQNALIYQAHPFRPGMEIIDVTLLDGIEVFNGNPRHDSRNDLAYRYATDHSLSMLSGSDFHRKEDLGRGGIITEDKPQSMNDVIDLLKEENYQLICSN